MSAVRVIETHTLRTLLGYRFLDAATDRPVRSGLRVTARRPGSTVRAHAARTSSGTWAFHRLPDLRALEVFGETPPPAPAPAPVEFVVEIEDGERRFGPVVHLATVPLDETADPPEVPPLDFFLFSAPERAVPPGIAAVRARLVDANEAPVPFAVLDVEAGNQQAFGVSDENGGVAVLFPVPAVEIALGGDPLSGQTSLQQASWPLTVRVRHEPAALVVPGGAPGGSGIPTLASIFAQSAGRFLDGGPPAETFGGTLVFGEEAVLRAGDTSHVVIAPA